MAFVFPDSHYPSSLEACKGFDFGVPSCKRARYRKGGSRDWRRCRAFVVDGEVSSILLEIVVDLGGTLVLG